MKTSSDKKKKNEVKFIIDQNDDAQKELKNVKIFRTVQIFTFLSFIFPLMGWVGYLISNYYKKNEKIQDWGKKSCLIGSFLAIVYSVIIASIIERLASKNEINIIYGCGFKGKCPPI